jgi:YHS domain-containing protein
MLKLSRRIAVRFLVLLAATVSVGSPPSFAEKPPLAIKGYDPVAYFTLGRPTPGLPELEYEWDEQRYRFARPEHRDLFKADPVRYAPQFANFCAMALTRGEIHEANPEYWLISDGKLYIFGGPTGPERFRQALTENVLKANQNKALMHKR